METRSKPWQPVTLATHRREEAVGAPRPVPDDGINETGDRDAIDQVAAKPGPADHRTGGNRRAGVCKRKLKEPDCEECDSGRFVRRGRALQEEPVIADESVAVAEHEGEAPCVEENAAE